MSTTQDFLANLRGKMWPRYDLKVLEKYAMEFYVNNQPELTPSIESLIEKIFLMADGAKHFIERSEMNAIIREIEMEEEDRRAKQEGIYTVRQLAKDLNELLHDGYDPVVVGRWATGIYLGRAFKFSQDVTDIIGTLMMMEEGPQFYLTEQEVACIVEDLINLS